MAHKDYLDKIIQQSIQLPAVEKRIIDNFFIMHLDRILNELGYGEEEMRKFTEDFKYSYQAYIKRIFMTLRDVKRYINGLRATLPTIHNEVNLTDYLILEVIRIFHPLLYSDIWVNPWFYIEIDIIDTLFLPSPFRMLHEKDRRKPIMQHIQSQLEDMPHKDAFLELLKKLFYVVDNAFIEGGGTFFDRNQLRKGKRISHPQCFIKYFTLMVPETELSDNYIETTLREWSSVTKDSESIINSTIEELQKSGKLHEFFNKLFIFFDIINSELAISIVRGLYKNASIYSRDDIDLPFNTEYDLAGSLIFHLINDKVAPDRMQEIMIEVVTNTTDLSFMTFMVFLSRQDKTRILEILKNINFVILRDIASGRLNDFFINGKRNIFIEYEKERDWAFILGQWISGWGIPVLEIKNTVNQYIITLLQENVRILIKFLKCFRSHPTTRGMTFDLIEMGKFYTLSEISKLVKININNNLLSKEDRDMFKLFLNLYENNNKDLK